MKGQASLEFLISFLLILSVVCFLLNALPQFSSFKQKSKLLEFEIKSNNLSDKLTLNYLSFNSMPKEEIECGFLNEIKIFNMKISRLTCSSPVSKRWFAK